MKPSCLALLVSGSGLPVLALAIAGTLLGCAHEPVVRPTDLPANVTSPMAIRTVAPTYPHVLQRMGVEGSVWVRCLVDQNGLVQKPSIAAVTEDAFASAALAALSQWEFAPGTRDGRPVAMSIVVPFHFTLEPDDFGRR